jgi:hypothetical protein
MKESKWESNVGVVGWNNNIPRPIHHIWVILILSIDRLNSAAFRRFCRFGVSNIRLLKLCDMQRLCTIQSVFKESMLSVYASVLALYNWFLLAGNCSLVPCRYVLVYFSILFVRYRGGIVSREMLSLPKSRFVLIGLLEALGAALGMAAAGNLWFFLLCYNVWCNSFPRS